MSYTPTTWQTGDTITANNLNKIEQGIKNNADAIPSSAADVGAIAAPSSPATGAFLVWNGSAWVAQTLSTWQGGSY